MASIQWNKIYWSGCYFVKKFKIVLVNQHFIHFAFPHWKFKYCTYKYTIFHHTIYETLWKFSAFTCYLILFLKTILNLNNKYSIISQITNIYRLHHFYQLIHNTCPYNLNQEKNSQFKIYIHYQFSPLNFINLIVLIIICFTYYVSMCVCVLYEIKHEIICKTFHQCS